MLKSNVPVLALFDYSLLFKKYFEYLRAYHGVCSTSPCCLVASYSRYTIESLLLALDPFDNLLVPSVPLE